MVGFYFGDPVDSATLNAHAADLVPSSSGDVLGAAFGSALHDLPTALLYREQLRQAQAGDGFALEGAMPLLEPQAAAPPPPPMLDAKTATERYGIPGVLSFDKPLPEATAADLHEAKHDEAVRADTIARGQGGLLGGAASRFGVGMLAGMLDPLNVASLFVPGLPETKVAAAFGEDLLGRLATRAVVGASQGIAGQAGLLPIGALTAAGEHDDDATMTDMLGQLAFGGLMGGALHSAIGGLGDLVGRRYARSRGAAAIETDPELAEAVTRTAVAQMAEGRPVEIEPLIDAALAEREALGRAYDTVRQNPQGPADDPLVRITPEDIEGAIVERGGWNGIGDVTVQGRGWGLAKFIFRHGEGSSKDPALQITRDDLLAFPNVIRDFEPTAGGSEGTGREWRVSLPGPDGTPRTVVFGDAPFARTDGERRVVTAYVQEPGRSGAESPLSQPRAGAPGSSSELVRPLGDTAEGLTPRTPQGQEAPAPQDVASPAAPIKRAAPRARQPVSLIPFLASRGGLALDQGGDLAAMDAHKLLVPGKGMLVRKAGGMALDRAREAAEEAGYLPAGSDTGDLLNALDEEMRGREQFALADQGAVIARQMDAQAAENARYYAALDQVRELARATDTPLSDEAATEAAIRIVQGHLPEDALAEATGGTGDAAAARKSALDAAGGRPDDADARASQAAADAAEASRTAPPPFDIKRVQGLEDAEDWMKRTRDAGALSAEDEAELAALEREWTDAAARRNAYAQAAACIARGGAGL